MTTILSHPVLAAGMAISAAAVLWLVRRRYEIRKNTLQEKHFQRGVESYQKISQAHSAIIQNGYVRQADWEKIKEAHWMAKTFLPQEIAQFTKEWLLKSTDALFLHQKIGRYGHPNVSSPYNDEEQIIAHLKSKDPDPIYRKYMPTL